jgi:hypothetical protein
MLEPETLELLGLSAEVIAVYPTEVRIAVRDLADFAVAGEKLRVGSHLRISDHDDCAIIAIIDNFSIYVDASGIRKYLIQASPIGFLDADNIFHRGGNNIAIPPTKVQPATLAEIQAIYNQIQEQSKFEFCSLANTPEIRVPVDGDKFFNKHIAIVGATGSGKSHAVAKIIQKAKESKASGYKGLNNSHVIVLDLHDEYRTAFPDANHLTVDSLKLPYWLLNEDELEELFVETGENQAYNQVSLLRRIVTCNKVKHSQNPKVRFGTPTFFSIDEVLNCIVNLSRETLDSNNRANVCFEKEDKLYTADEPKYNEYFLREHRFKPTKTGSVVKGP